jgi:hypothetical protein
MDLTANGATKKGAVAFALLYLLLRVSITMKKICFLLLFLFCSSYMLRAQEVLPGITVKNFGGKIIVSWKNEYKVTLANINIQRSYDSLKNYTSIGTVLNPQNNENGYADVNAPYTKMYYRLFIAFEGGSYIISEPVRPSKDTGSGSSTLTVKYPWQLDPNSDPKLQVPPPPNTNLTPPNPALNFPSKWLYTAKDNNVIIHLPDAATKKYTVSFFDELEKMIFELNNLKEEYLIIEKVNFVRSGWYRFELFESGKLVEKNKFFIPKDGKITNDPLKKTGNY